MTDRQDRITINAVADRAMAMFERDGLAWQKSDVMMDIENTHRIIPLKLGELLIADEANFAHDMCGIYNNFNRQTKEMDNFFCPRYAR
jgi:hypothetical protein